MESVVQSRFEAVQETPPSAFTPSPTLASLPTERPRVTARWGRSVRNLPALTWAAMDWTLVALATFLAYNVMVFNNPAFGWVVGPWFSGVAFGLCHAIAGMIFGLYEPSTLLSRGRIVSRTALTLGLGAILAYAIIYVGFYASSSRWIALWVIFTHVTVATPIRLFAHSLLCNSRINVLCVGTAASVRKVVSLIQNGHRGHYHIVGHVLVPREGAPPSAQSRFLAMDSVESGLFDHLCPCVGAISELPDLIRSHNIDQVIVDPELATHPKVGEAVLECLDAGCPVSDQPSFAEKLLGEVPAETINASWFMLADVTRDSAYDAVKRLVDVAAGVTGLLLTAPAWPLIWLAVKLDSPGPVIYSQQRVGLNGRVFTIYKVRTMRQDAEQHGAQWAKLGDARVTRLGRFFRKSRIDEVPQFWNILIGDMSIVGPRPERPEFVEQLAGQVPHYRQRHLIKPGLTGWAQIHYRYGASVEDAHRKLCYDLYYLKHRSFELDAGIIVRTLGAFVSGSR